jgi:regulator of sigma E protease
LLAFDEFCHGIGLVYPGFHVVGTPANINVIGEVISGQPAARAGIQSGDRIVEINGKKVQNWEEIVNTIHKNPGEKLRLTVTGMIRLKYLTLPR